MIVMIALATSLIMGASGQVETSSVLYGTLAPEQCYAWKAESEQRDRDTTDRSTGRPLIARYYQCVITETSKFTHWAGQSDEEMNEKTWPD